MWLTYGHCALHMGRSVLRSPQQAAKGQGRWLAGRLVESQKGTHESTQGDLEWLVNALLHLSRISLIAGFGISSNSTGLPGE